MLTVGAWVACTVALSVGVESLVNADVAERIAPFSNAHLLEEAELGQFIAVRDPWFLSASLVVGTLSFLVPHFWASYGAQRRELWMSTASLVAALVAFVWLFAFVLSAGYPEKMVLAFLSRVAIFAFLGLLGLVAGFRLGRAQRMRPGMPYGHTH